jgi:L,D-transpeptidase YcbB
MQYFFRSLVLLLLLAGLSHCVRKAIPYDSRIAAGTPDSTAVPDGLTGEVGSTFLGHYLDRDSLVKAMRSYMEQIGNDPEFRVSGRSIFAVHSLPVFYARNGHQPAWGTADTRNEALECLQSAYLDGLLPADYHIDTILHLAGEIGRQDLPDYHLVAQLDLLISDGLMLYGYHLLRGKVLPETMEVNWNFSRRDAPVSPDRLLEEAIRVQGVAQGLAALRPAAPVYARYIEKMKYYLALQAAGGWPVFRPKGVIKPDQSYAELPVLRRRLMIEDYLTAGSAVADSLRYDSLLVEAVKRFQFRHGLTPDGVIGARTVEALNMRVEDKIAAIRVNQERVRWLAEYPGDAYLEVNIAAYRLHFFEKGVLTFKTNVMVGKPYTQTPVFQAPMKYIDFNPTWTVPYSIATKEILPKLQQDPGYLAANNMVLLSPSGKPVDAAAVDWATVAPRSFPYIVRQEPGRSNALGRVKFMFPNKHDVYLHDTPSRHLFVRDDRAFSHGCIRVQQPLDLAEVLLRHKPGWNRERIDRVVADGKTTRVNLDHPLTVRLLYLTAGLGDDGELFFNKDIYNRDPRLLAALDAQNPEHMYREYRRRIEPSEISGVVTGE